MKYVVISLLTLCSLAPENTLAQKSTKVDPNEHLLHTQRLVTSLHDLHQIHLSVYFNTIKWIFSTNMDKTSNKEDLSKLIDIEYPKVKLAIDKHFNAVPNATYHDSVRQLLTDVYKMIGEAQLTMRTLDSEAKYVTGDPLVRPQSWIDVQRRLEKDMRPLFLRTEEKFKRTIRFYEDQTKSFLAMLDVPGKGNPSTLHIAVALSRYQSVETTRTTAHYIALNSWLWVYTPEDGTAKNQLKAFVNKSTSGDQFLTDLQVYLERLRETGNFIMDELMTKEQYEDALVRLMAEDRLETGLEEEYRLVTRVLRLEKKSAIDEWEYLLAHPKEQAVLKKRQDIIQLLRNNEPNFVRLINDLKRVQQATEKNGQQPLPDILFDDIVDALVPVYDKRFTHEEILKILEFQSSDVGKKFLKESSMMAVECQEIIVQYMAQRRKQQRSK